MKHLSNLGASHQWTGSNNDEASIVVLGDPSLSGSDEAIIRIARSPLRRQSGIALLTALLILIMLTLLAVAMFRGFGLQQKIAGNVREKERAFQAAENALQYGEWWLSPANPNPPPQDTGTDCTTSSANITVTTPADMRVCSTPLAKVSDPTNWTGALVYTPPKMTVATGGGVAADGNGNTDINYAQPPKLYIAYLGLSPTAKEKLYSVTAAGFGGSTTSTAVVQSVVAVSLCGGGTAVSIDGTSSC